MNRQKSILYSLDWLTIITYVILVFIGWFCIYSSVYNPSNQFDIFDTSQRHGMQSIWVSAAFILAFVIMLFDTKVFTVLALPLYLGSILLLLFVLVAGVEVNNSKSWLAIGSVRLQPVELAKVATALMLSYVMSEYGFKLASISNILKLFIIFAIPSGLIFLQKDTGSVLVFTSFSIMLYREGMNGWIIIGCLYVSALFIAALLLPAADTVWLLVALAVLIYIFLSNKVWKCIKAAFLFFIGIVAAMFINIETRMNIETEYIILFCSAIFSAVLLLKYREHIAKLLFVIIFFFSSVFISFSVDYVFENILKPHQKSRIENLLGMQVDPQGTGYNVNQSKIAIGSGGMFGKGFLQGTQTKFNFVPEQSTDFIFCTVGEETGFVGSLIVILLYLFLLFRIITIAERQRFAFTRIYAYCIFGILFFHFAANIGMTIGLLPVIGIPLPFLSYGGSSLLAFTAMLFILLKLDTAR